MLASISVAFPLSDVLKLGAAMGAVLKGGEVKLGELVDEAVEAADVGRKGAADLEKHVDAIKNYFFRDGVQMVVDGYSLDELTEIKVCVGYEVGKNKYNYLPFDENIHNKLTPIYETIPGLLRF